MADYGKEIQQLTTWIQESDNIVFFGGAGVSTESKIPESKLSTVVFLFHNQPYSSSYSLTFPGSIDFVFFSTSVLFNMT